MSVAEVDEAKRAGCKTRLHETAWPLSRLRELAQLILATMPRSRDAGEVTALMTSDAADAAARLCAWIDRQLTLNYDVMEATAERGCRFDRAALEDVGISLGIDVGANRGTLCEDVRRALDRVRPWIWTRLGTSAATAASDIWNWADEPEFESVRARRIREEQAFREAFPRSHKVLLPVTKFIAPLLQY